jgi:hypothetical protein
MYVALATCAGEIQCIGFPGGRIVQGETNVWYGCQDSELESKGEAAFWHDE